MLPAPCNVVPFLLSGVIRIKDMKVKLEDVNGVVHSFEITDEEARKFLQGVFREGYELDVNRFPRAKFRGTEFRDALFRNGCLGRSTFDGVSFAKATFKECAFIGATFEGSCFKGSDLSNADLEGATLPAGYINKLTYCTNGLEFCEENFEEITIEEALEFEKRKENK